MEKREIRRALRGRVRISLPPSKSYTQRALVAAALAPGESVILNPSRSADSAVMMGALGMFGVGISDEGGLLRVRGLGGEIPPGDRTIDVGNAGTCMRFLTAFAALAPGTTTLTGDQAMRRRPVLDLVHALADAGVDVRASGGHPPVVVRGGRLSGGSIGIDAVESSQFLSALLLVSPYAGGDLEMRVAGGLSSAPYVSMTLCTMKAFGVVPLSDGRLYRVAAGRGYLPCEYAVEPDVSGATVFGTAAAVTGCTVEIPGIPTETLQGDVGFFPLLREMGCHVTVESAGVIISGGSLRGIRADMNSLPDSVPALSVAAAFAATPTTLTNVAHLRHKETDRLAALGNELGKIGARAEVTRDSMTITPGPLHGAEIETYNDHRIAMSFAAAGLAIGGVRIRNPGCVAKSFPGFWTELEKFT